MEQASEIAQLILKRIPVNDTTDTPESNLRGVEFTMVYDEIRHATTDYDELRLTTMTVTTAL